MRFHWRGFNILEQNVKNQIKIMIDEARTSRTRWVALKRTSKKNGERSLAKKVGWMEGKEIDVLSLHLQPQKHQVCGALQWSGSSSELLQPRLKHTHRV